MRHSQILCKKKKIQKKRKKEGLKLRTYRVRIKNEIPSVYTYRMRVCIKNTRENGVPHSRVPRLRFHRYII